MLRVFDSFSRDKRTVILLHSFSLTSAPPFTVELNSTNVTSILYIIYDTDACTSHTRANLFSILNVVISIGEKGEIGRRSCIVLAIRTNHASRYSCSGLSFREHGSRPTTAWTGNGSKASDTATRSIPRDHACCFIAAAGYPGVINAGRKDFRPV